MQTETDINEKEMHLFQEIKAYLNTLRKEKDKFIQNNECEGVIVFLKEQIKILQVEIDKVEYERNVRLKKTSGKDEKEEIKSESHFNKLDLVIKQIKQISDRLDGIQSKVDNIYKDTKSLRE